MKCIVLDCSNDLGKRRICFNFWKESALTEEIKHRLLWFKHDSSFFHLTLPDFIEPDCKGPTQRSDSKARLV